jgi:hypothetical protein
MAVGYDGIDRMLADMQWSTKSAYQIQSTFYVISQLSVEASLCQTATRHDGAARSVDVLWEREHRCRVIEPANLFEGETNHEVGIPPTIRHCSMQVFALRSRVNGGCANEMCRALSGWLRAETLLSSNGESALVRVMTMF